MCKKHYDHWRRNRRNAICDEPNCERFAHARGMCMLHYTRWRRDQDLSVPALRRRACPLTMPQEEAKLGYLGGLLDGEGCITRTAQDGIGYWRVKVLMTDKEIIDWLADMGGTVSSSNRRGVRKRSWGWYLSSQWSVRIFLLAVLPYMKIRAKRDRALMAIDEIDEKLAAGTPLWGHLPSPVEHRGEEETLF